MSRSFSSSNLVQLPRLGASETSVLLTELATTAAHEREQIGDKKLPPAIERSHRRMIAAHQALSKALLPAPPSEADPARRRQADGVIDNAWSAAYDWTSGWSKLPDSAHPQVVVARTLQQLVFADGLGFTKLPYKVEWQESKTRLEAIDRDGHEETFKLLGGLPFLTEIRRAHVAYGEALGITQVVAPTESQVSALRTARDAALDALRDYTTKVAAHADPEEEGSEQLSERLLRPLTSWETTHRESPKASATTPPAPATPPAPTPA
jgi:hypothetical protein